MSKDAERLIVAIRNAKLVFPDQRIGQLIQNAVYTIDRDIFYVTDAELAEVIEKFTADFK